MLVPTCDRCGDAHVQLTTILGVEVCNDCVSATATFLRTPPAPRASCDELFDQAMALIRRVGFCDAAALAEIRGEPRRKTYEELHWLRRKGWLVHMKRGRFVAAGGMVP